MPARRSITVLFAILLAALFGHGTVCAQTWPARPITIVVSAAAGGGIDSVIRTISQRLSERLGQPIVVDNRAGASGMLAARFVTNAPADGYTLLATEGGVMALNAALYADPGYDPVRDFAAVSMLIRAPMLLVATQGFDVADLPALVDLSKKRNVNYGASAKGSYPHLAMELLKSRTGLRAQHIPYKGASPVALAAVAGQVEIAVIDTIVAMPLVRAGKLKALAVLTKNRIAIAPEIPTAAEQGVADVEVFPYVGVVAPRKTPAAVVERLSSEFRAVIQTPEVARQFRDAGMEPMATSPSDFESYVDAEARKWHPIIHSLGLRGQ